MFEYDLAAAKWVPAHHPFTAPYEADMANLVSDPASVRANCYDLAMNGLELGSGSIRIHRKDVQQQIFASLGIWTRKRARASGSSSTRSSTARRRTAASRWASTAS